MAAVAAAATGAGGRATLGRASRRRRTARPSASAGTARTPWSAASCSRRPACGSNSARPCTRRGAQSTAVAPSGSEAAAAAADRWAARTASPSCASRARRRSRAGTARKWCTSSSICPDRWRSTATWCSRHSSPRTPAWRRGPRPGGMASAGVVVSGYGTRVHTRVLAVTFRYESLLRSINRRGQGRRCTPGPRPRGRRGPGRAHRLHPRSARFRRR